METVSLAKLIELGEAVALASEANSAIVHWCVSDGDESALTIVRRDHRTGEILDSHTFENQQNAKGQAYLSRARPGKSKSLASP